MQNIARLRSELAHLNVRRVRLETEIDVLQDLVKGVAQLDGASEKKGPAEAIRTVLRANRDGITRRALIDRARELVSTSPDKARKTLDQTIRNLRDVREENNLVFLVGNENGHSE
jgi:hypothetical protein